MIADLDPAFRANGSVVPPEPSSNPYLGLRSFTADDAHLFFGRDRQTRALVKKLSQARFVAVVGTSGSGKSSLVQAGLIPALWAGYLREAGPEWCVARFQPGSHPLRALLASLNDSNFFERRLLEEDLTRSSRSLRELVEGMPAEHGKNLLILVDQFEELFRLEPSDKSFVEAREEQRTLVRTLLEVSQGAHLPVYAVITMRSDFIGDCAQFRDLAEAVSNRQYLVPRTTREERQSIIEGPSRVAGAEVCNDLVQRILNEVGDDPDQLPVLQHALMRTWARWAGLDVERPIDTEDYEAIGTLRDALSLHADEACQEAAGKVAKGATIVKRMFQRLRDRDPNGREIRRPTPIAELAAVAGVDESQVRECIEPFRRDDRTLLRLSEDERSADVTHECLLRQWKTLTQVWVVEELESRRRYLRLIDRAEQTDLLLDPVLQGTLDWWHERSPTEAWAQRYDERFSAAKEFLERSVGAREEARQAAHDAEEKRREVAARATIDEFRRQWEEHETARRNKLTKIFVTGLFAVVFIGFLVSWNLYLQERNARQRASEAVANERKARESTVIKMLALRALAEKSDDSGADVPALLAATSLRREPALETQILLSNILAKTPLRVATLRTGQEHPKLAFGERGDVLAVAGGEKLAFWDVARHALLRDEPIPPGQVIAIDWARRGDKIAVLTESGGVVMSHAGNEPRFEFTCAGPGAVSLDDAADRLVATCGERAQFYARVKQRASAAPVYKLDATSRVARAGVGWMFGESGNEVGRLRWQKPNRTLNASAAGSSPEDDSPLAYVVSALDGSSPEETSLPSSTQWWSASGRDLTRLVWWGVERIIWTDTVDEDFSIWSDRAERKAFPTAGLVANAVLSRDTAMLAGVTRDSVVQVWRRDSARETLRAKLDVAVSEDVALAFDDVRGVIAVARGQGDVNLVEPLASQALSLRGPSISDPRQARVLAYRDSGLAALEVTPEGVKSEKAELLAEDLFGAYPFLGFEISRTASFEGRSITANWLFSRLQLRSDDHKETIALRRTFRELALGHIRDMAFSADGKRLCVGMLKPPSVDAPAEPKLRPPSPTTAPDPDESAADTGSLLAFITLRPAGDEGAKSQVDYVVPPSGAATWAFAPSGSAVYADSTGEGSEQHPVLVRSFQNEASWKETPIVCQGACTAIAISPDGRWLAVADNPHAAAQADGVASATPPAGEARSKPSVTLWTSEGQRVVILPQAAAVRSLTFSSSGKLLAAAAPDGAHVWDLERVGSVMLPPEREKVEIARVSLGSPIEEVGFSADERFVVVVTDRQAEAFYVRTNDILRDACRRIGRDLTRAEWDVLVPGEPYEGICEGLKNGRINGAAP